MRKKTPTARQYATPKRIASRHQAKSRQIAQHGPTALRVRAGAKDLPGTVSVDDRRHCPRTACYFAERALRVRLVGRRCALSPNHQAAKFLQPRKLRPAALTLTILNE